MGTICFWIGRAWSEVNWLDLLYAAGGSVSASFPAAVVAVTTLISAGGNQAAQAAPRDETTTNADDGHERYEAILKKTMTGPVDIYFDVTEMEDESPRLADMTFSGLVDVTGKHLLSFADAKGNSWLVDPDTVLTYRIRRAKND